MRARIACVVIGAVLGALVLGAHAAPAAAATPTARTIWVDPVRGRDGRSGATRATALRTLTAAWNRIPRERTLTRGYRIRITPGTLRARDVPNYFEQRRGTARAPITIESAFGRGTARLPALNIFDVSHLTLARLRISSRLGDVVHCEQCTNFTLSGSVVRGAPAASGLVQEAVKVNQSQQVLLIGNDISGASDNPLDFVAVQHAQVRGNRLHDGGDWCAYAKGGSAYVRFEANELFDCGTGGFTAGQGTGAQFMTAPWIQYEAYDVRAVNNVVHDVEGAAFGVNGGWNVLIAHNTAYRTGSRDHLLEVVAGHRSCDGRPGDDGRERCAEHTTAGGWSTTVVDDGENYRRIPNRHVYVYDNLFVNPPGAQSQYTHFVVARAYDGVLFDDDLRIAGNVIWNGPADHPLGLGGEEFGCADDHPTCAAALVLASNTINVRQPSLRAPGRRNWRIASASRAFLPAAVAIPSFPDEQPSLAIPGPATRSNTVTRDRAGAVRRAGSDVGAYAS